MKKDKKRAVSLPKLIVQIPAYNEEKTIGKVIREIPRKIKGVKDVRVLVIDDGSSDKTSEIARKAGADYVIKNSVNSGLAYSFQKGLNAALSFGADIIVNTDADFQYNQTEIPKLIKPILDKKADMVSGNRYVEKLDHMSFVKKYGNIIGSKVVKVAAGNSVEDASSGFRAYTKEAALRLFVTSKHTYTHETLIQAERKNLKVVEVPVEFRKRQDGDSKLIKSVYGHVKKSGSTIVRTTLMYNSLRAFSYFGLVLILIGAFPIIRWYYLTYISDIGGNHLQSLVLGSVFLIFGGLSILLGLIADLLAINRKHLEEIMYRVRRLEMNLT